MKLKFASILNSKLSRAMCNLLARMTSKRMILLGVGAAAGLFLSGCAVDGVGFVADSGYSPYSGAYYGGYGPYDGGEIIVGGVRHGGHYGGHHFYGNSFGRGGYSGGSHGGSFHGGGHGHGGGGHGGGHGH